MENDKEMLLKLRADGAEVRYFNPNLRAEKRAADGGTEKRIITGYALKFDTLSNLLGGWFKERISRGALDGCDMSDVIACFNHDDSKILARTSSGTLTLAVDETGLRYEFECPATSYGNDLWESVSRGDITQSSFMFVVEETIWESLDGVDVRTIMKIKRMYDVSPVVWPAYNDTEVAKRSFEAQKKVVGDTALLAKRKRELRKLEIN